MLGLALEKEEVYYIPVQGMITGAYLADKLLALSKTTLLCSWDVKAMLKHAPIEDTAHVFDAGVGRIS